ncbi:uncharacterized protein F5891DRAFT_1190253 [Suillus fuscotomentosus]|uniref:Uncharacterized protein n=1 Tax=Suillus fuscotomentosus TaxID=1912939 RepID=A0AAD4E3K9_9AGAM|nr:uncharacterized protein F5891DRAFT_1190253 [Suillus fuscotomentosus]KAG1899061.1 hypothetical protein F5891DRAFT_1190253 [Suillus fuscotomentosus]
MRIHPDKAEDVNLLNSSPGCICLWLAVSSDKQQALLRPFTATIRFPDLDLPDSASSSPTKHAFRPTARDTEALTFLREIVKISWYELDGMDIETVMKLTRISAGEQEPTLQEVKEYLKAWGVPLSVQSRVAQSFCAP